MRYQGSACIEERGCECALRRQPSASWGERSEKKYKESTVWSWTLASRVWENKFLLHRPLIYGILLWQPEQTNTVHFLHSCTNIFEHFNMFKDHVPILLWRLVIQDFFSQFLKILYMRQYFGDSHLSPPHHVVEDSLEKEMATHSQYYCLENPMDRGVWPIVHEVAKSQTELPWWLRR